MQEEFLEVNGTIYDSQTGDVLPGALVTLTVGDTELIEHTPAKDGEFSYEFDTDSLPKDVNVLTCIIQKPGYQTYQSKYGLPEDRRGSQITVTAELRPVLINWKRILIATAIILGSLLLLAALVFGIKYFFYGPKEDAIASFSIKPRTINAGEEAEVKWKTIHGDAVLLEKDRVNAEGVMTVSPPKTRKYILTVKDGDGKVLDIRALELKVIPPPPNIEGFTATPLEINLWESTTLKWKTTGAEVVYIYTDTEKSTYDLLHKMIKPDDRKLRKITPEELENEPGAKCEEKKKELNGSAPVSPLKTTTYTLLAVNSIGVKREQSLEVRVLKAPEVCLKVNKKVINRLAKFMHDWEKEDVLDKNYIETGMKTVEDMFKLLIEIEESKKK